MVADSSSSAFPSTPPSPFPDSAKAFSVISTKHINEYDDDDDDNNNDEFRFKDPLIHEDHLRQKQNQVYMYRRVNP